MNILRKIFLLTALLICAQYLAAQQSRKSIGFNSGWFFHKGDHATAHHDSTSYTHWQAVMLPHTWNDTDVLADGQRGYYRGVGWYKRQFELQPVATKRYYLRFEGVNQECEVYINGQLAGSHVGGYTAFNVDITSYLNPEASQRVAIKVDNKHNENIPPLSADFTFFGGIYRSVQLVTTHSQVFSMTDYGGSGVYVSMPKVSAEQADVQIEYHLTNYEDQARPVEVHTRIQGDTELFRHEKALTLLPGRDTIIRIAAPNITGYELWDVDDPNLYQVESRIVADGIELDRVSEQIGFRYFHFDPDEGFFLNGSPTKLLGANRHQDRIPFGNALNSDMHKQDMFLLKDMGSNFFRTAHYPQAKEVLDLADQLGLVVWEEIPLVNEVTRNEAYWETAHQMVQEMVKQHYNHPSIFIWAYMNEIYWAHRFKPEEELPSRNEYTVALARSLENLIRDMDPYRYTAMAMHNYPAYEETGIGDIPMIAAWNLYHGWYYDDFEDFGKFMDREKEKYPHRVHIISEFGAGGHVGLYSNNPERFDFSVEGQIAFTQSIIKQIKERPYIAGGALWNLVDFSSESRVDATPHINNKGLVTADRRPKDAYLLAKAMFSDEPVAELGYPFRSEWLYAAKSAQDSLMPLEMYAYSNLAYLDLFVNGQHVGRTDVVDGKASWMLSLPEGRHLVSLSDEFTAAGKTIDVEILPFELPAKGLDLAVNLGANYTFIDERTGLQWIEERTYTPGSWGVVGGERLYIANKIGTKEDILSVNVEDALYQTMLVGLDGFRANVQDGTYEVELLMVDYVPRSRRFVDDKEVNFRTGQRIFDIISNGNVLVEKLDLGGQYGQNVPVRLTFKQTVSDGTGINIQFHAIKGKAILSAIRIKSTAP